MKYVLPANIDETYTEEDNTEKEATYLGVICLTCCCSVWPCADAWRLGVELEVPCWTVAPGMGLVTMLMEGRLGDDPNWLSATVPASRFSRVLSGVSNRLPDMDNSASSLTDDRLTLGGKFIHMVRYLSVVNIL